MFFKSVLYILYIFASLNNLPDARGQQVEDAKVQPQWSAEFLPNATIADMETKFQVELELKTFSQKTNHGNFIYQVKSENTEIAIVEEKVISEKDFDGITFSWAGNITIDPLFLGETNIFVERIDTATNKSEHSKNTLNLIVIRKEKVIDHIFKGSIILLCCLIYINFGAALDLNVLKTLAAKPVGPSIGFCCQLVIMPLLSYGLGYVIFPDSPNLQLGLFFTGVSPSGGASNIWTVILNGNINLSVLMTTLSNLAALVLMPAWLFSLGAHIFRSAKIEVPYSRIGSLSAGLVIPLIIGLVIQKCSSRLTRVLVRSLKTLSSCLLIFIIVFAIVVNWYIFKLFSWQIILAGFALPFLGYCLGWLAAKTFGQEFQDSLTIAIETGIQNTGIAIFMLRTLPPPISDITTVIPVAVAVMTPLPLFGIYLYNRFSKRQLFEVVEETQHIH